MYFYNSYRNKYSKLFLLCLYNLHLWNYGVQCNNLHLWNYGVQCNNLHLWNYGVQCNNLHLWNNIGSWQHYLQRKM